MEKTNQKLFLVVSIWINDDRIAEFEAYEKRAAKLLEKHGRRIERAIRIEKQSNESGAPFEIHIVSFPNEEKYADYRADYETRRLADLRARIVRRAEIFFGFDAENYHEQKSDIHRN